MGLKERGWGVFREYFSLKNEILNCNCVSVINSNDTLAHLKFLCVFFLTKSNSFEVSCFITHMKLLIAMFHYKPCFNLQISDFKIKK